MKTLLKNRIVVAIALLVILVIGWRLLNREDPRSLQHLSKVAAEINKSVPVMIDAETELLPVSAAAGLLTYNYRLVNYSLAQLDPRKFAAGAKPQITQNACERPETRDDFLKNGVTLRYSYFDKDKKPIVSIDVTPKDCGF